MPKHTPAPWRFQHNGSWQTNPYSVTASAKGVHSTTIANIPARRSIPSWEWESNARLIAAAPDLLDALHAVQKLMDFSSPPNENHITATDCFGTLWEEAEAKVRAAIAQATGDAS